MIEYAVVNPGETASELRIHKYPFVASEILSIPDEAVLDLYFKDDSHPANEENAGESQGKAEADPATSNSPEESKSEPNEPADTKLESSENIPESASDPIDKPKENKEGNVWIKENINPEEKPKALDYKEEKELAETNQNAVTDIKEDTQTETQPNINEKSEAELEDAKETPAADSPPNTGEGAEGGTDEWNPREEAKFVPSLQSDPSEQFALTNTFAKDTPDKYNLVCCLFSFVAVDPGFEFNELLAGYFKRAAMTLIAGRPRDMSSFFEKNPEIVERLFTHSVNQSISDVLCKALSIPEMAIDNPAWFDKTFLDILEKFLVRLEDPATESSDLAQTVSTFCNLLDQCHRFQYYCCIVQVARRLFRMSMRESREVSFAALNVLTKLMLLDESGFVLYLAKKLSFPPSKGRTKEEDNDLLEIIGQQLEFFKGKLMEEYEPVVRQCGKVRPLGVYRLKIVEYVGCVIKLGTFAITEYLDKLMYPKLLWSLFTRFPMNSVLHGVVFEIFKYVFESRCKSLLYVVAFGLKGSS